jgi:hypothetical protein
MAKSLKCKVGEEKFKEFHPKGRGAVVQYDYRSAEGELFSCTGKDIDSCRKKKEDWLSRRI